MDSPRIASVGHAVGDVVVTSRQLELELGLPSGWIQRRTGIVERRVCPPDQAVSDIAIAAGASAIAGAEATLSAPGAPPIGLVLLATSTPDHLLPPTAPKVAHALGLSCGAIDLAGACAGFLYALSLGDAHARTSGDAVLVIGANILSRRSDPDDAQTRPLFGDAAGAALLIPGARPGRCLRGIYLASDGSRAGDIMIPAGGSRHPTTPEDVATGRTLMQMERGPMVFREAVRAMVRSARATLETSSMSIDAIDWWLPHQANRRITEEAGRRLEIPPARTISILDRFGNSSAATIPLALSLSEEGDRLAPEHTLLLTAVGAGMLEAGVVLSP